MAGNFAYFLIAKCTVLEFHPDARKEEEDQNEICGYSIHQREKKVKLHRRQHVRRSTSMGNPQISAKPPKTTTRNTNFGSGLKCIRNTLTTTCPNNRKRGKVIEMEKRENKRKRRENNNNNKGEISTEGSAVSPHRFCFWTLLSLFARLFPGGANLANFAFLRKWGRFPVLRSSITRIQSIATI